MCLRVTQSAQSRNAFRQYLTDSHGLQSSDNRRSGNANDGYRRSPSAGGEREYRIAAEIFLQMSGHSH